MPKPFSDNEARALIKRAESLISSLERSAQARDAKTARMLSALDAYEEAELHDILAGIPVDEVNRDRLGIRTQSLKNAGIHTVDDLYRTRDLEAIPGIGAENAQKITAALEKIVVSSRGLVRLRLSADAKTPEATAIVRAIFDRLCAESPSLQAAKILSSIGPDLRKYIGNLKAGTEILIWFLAPKAKRDAAEEAFLALREMLQSPVAQEAETVSRQLAIAPRDDVAWDVFEKNPILFNNVVDAARPSLLAAADERTLCLPETLALAVQDQEVAFDGLLCTLRRYQVWGVKYILHQKRVLLGDEMGLGKTVQAIAAMVSLRNAGEAHFIVVCPASVLENWCREIVKHSTLVPIKIHGEDKEREAARWLAVGGVAVTTYDSSAAIKLPELFAYGMIVADEAHFVKNPDAQRTRRVIDLAKNTDRVLFMTGTALENRVDEMLQLISFLQPDVAREASKIAFLSGAQQFRDAVAPVYYRRRREDVLAELPALIEAEEWCTLCPEEKTLYERSVLEKDRTAIRRVSWKILDGRADISLSAKAQRLAEIIAQAEDEGRKVLVFSYFLDTIRVLESLFSDRCAGVITGAASPTRRLELVNQFEEAGAGSILIAQIISGGTGLNIHTASVVVICEPQVKPSIENQAISRAYRMGQARNVLVFRLLAVGTLDERMMGILYGKQLAFDAFADRSSAAEAQETEVDGRTFEQILEEEVARIKRENPVLAAEYEEPENTQTVPTAAPEDDVILEVVDDEGAPVVALPSPRDVLPPAEGETELPDETAVVAPENRTPTRKVIVCELCGGHELRKQDGEFVCTACGTRYTLEEARKLLFDSMQDHPEM